MPPQPRGGQFRTGVQQTLDDHGHDEVALARGFRGQQAFEAELAQGAEHGFEVTVGGGSARAGKPGGRDKGFAGERAADDGDQGAGRVREVAESFAFAIWCVTTASDTID